MVEGISFEHVGAELFSQAFSNLESFTFINSFGYCASDPQIELLLLKILHRKPRKVQSIHLSLINMSHLSSTIIASLAESSIKVHLRECCLSASQVKELQEGNNQLDILEEKDGETIITFLKM